MLFQEQQQPSPQVNAILQAMIRSYRVRGSGVAIHVATDSVEEQFWRDKDLSQPPFQIPFPFHPASAISEQNYIKYPQRHLTESGWVSTNVHLPCTRPQWTWASHAIKRK
jgi:hypothetical protein